MGIPRRYAAKRDHNEGPLMRLARTLGARLELAGPLDLWMWHAKTGWVPVEIKNPTGRNRYTDDQVDFIERCKAWRMPVLTWRTREDVFKTLGADDSWNQESAVKRQKSLSPAAMTSSQLTTAIADELS